MGVDSDGTGLVPDKATYVERITGWLMPDRQAPETARKAREGYGLDGVYLGKSRRIAALVRLAYLRGVRRGASCAWQAAQPLILRGTPEAGPQGGE